MSLGWWPVREIFVFSLVQWEAQLCEVPRGSVDLIVLFRSDTGPSAVHYPRSSEREELREVDGGKRRRDRPYGWNDEEFVQFK